MERERKFSNPAENAQAVYGIHAVLEALDSGLELNKVLIQKDIRNEQFDLIVNLCKKKKVPFQFVPRDASAFNANQNHQGVVAYVSPIGYYKLEDLLPQLFEEGKTPFILLLDRITDVRNFGAIARSAYCAGVDTIIIPDSGSAQVSEDAIKTSAGALLKIPVCREKNMKSTMELLNQSGVQTVACTEKANKDLNFVDLTIPTCIVMGSEDTGISTEVLKKCSVLARIPLTKGVASLNVSVAAGIAVYETIRQRM
ncbi:MAG: 23S rRNA (guanosine(2251)-2'-O)-methyltransferase RlmB [Bacteroidota bacterium]|jgi:23S rRNA (guanosine2251-2'-O)-methyltransferase